MSIWVPTPSTKNRIRLVSVASGTASTQAPTSGLPAKYPRTQAASVNVRSFQSGSPHAHVLHPDQLALLVQVHNPVDPRPRACGGITAPTPDA
jgi:hypothetical protein